jgi:protein-S-isoprenylcysteine O-methyltransferase Ste14
MLRHGHELIVDGPYRRARHPIYTGILVAFAGTALAIGELRGLIAVVIAAVAYWRKVGLEEALLRREFGEAYDDYAHRVKALNPVRALGAG